MKKSFYFIVALATLAFVSCGNKPEEKSDASIAINVTVDANKGTYEITPTDLETPYFYSYYTIDDFKDVAEADYADSALVWALGMIDFLNEYKEFFGLEEDITFADFTGKGVEKGTFEIDEAGDYIFVAFYVDIDAKTIKGDKVFTKTFSVAELPVSVNKITLTYNTATGNLDITTTNNDPYYVAVFPEEYYNQYQQYGYDDADILADDLEYQVEYAQEDDPTVTAEDFLFSGSFSYDFQLDYGGMDAGHYYALAGVYQYGRVNSEVAVLEFDIPEAEQAEAPAKAKKQVKAVISKKVAKKALLVK